MAAAACLTPFAAAQGFNNQWVTYAADPTQTDLQGLSSNNTETDLAWGDLNGDGWIDMAVVRKQPYTSPGKRTNTLLVNEGGVLTDVTAAMATAADVPGDQGFLTPTNDRDVRFDDFDLDGWLDLVTAPTLSDGDPKHIGHPRVYMNQGESGGAWAGLRFEDARVPQMFQFATGNPQNPRFCSVANGDVTGNGYPDLYFGDYDSSGAGGSGQAANQDLNDRLFINDGAGFFADESQARMTGQMLASAFGNSVVIADFNGDGHNDIVKDTSLQNPTYVAISYNDPKNVGTFNIFDDFHSFAPYHTSEGDLNNDGRLDLIISDDGSDRFRLNLSTDTFGRVVWGPAETLDYLSLSDDGFASNNLIADLDGDGWNDVLIADVDVDISGTNRRLHIFHNVTAQTGSVTLLEERQQAGTAGGFFGEPNEPGWVGVVGLLVDDLKGTHDIAVADFDRDGDNDLVISRFEGTFMFDNQADPVVCQTDLGFGGPGNVTLSVCGAPLYENNSATVTVDSDQAGSLGVLAISTTLTPLPLFGGTIVALPAAVTFDFATDAGGGWTLPFSVSATASDLFAQAVVIDLSLPELIAISNAIEMPFNP